MRHGISCAHRPRRRAGRLRRAPDQNNARNGCTRGSQCRERRARLWRPGVLAAAAAGITLLAAACGGSTPTTAAHQTVYQKELAYAQCMRAHGDPGFPDPQSDGTFNSTKADRGALAGPQFLSANRACAHLEGPGMTAAQQERFTSQALKFAACMRAHGITNFQYSPPHGGGPAGLGAQGANPSSPQFQAALRACRKLQP